MVGSYARVFDKISSQYGWEDEKILDLTVSRMRQISATIDERLWLEAFRQRQLVAWQTRTSVAWMVKLTSGIEPDMAKTLMEEASNISLDNVNPSKGTSSTTPKAAPGIASKKDFYNMSDEEIEQHLGKSDNGNGSFEALIGGFRAR